MRYFQYFLVDTTHTYAQDKDYTHSCSYESYTVLPVHIEIPVGGKQRVTGAVFERGGVPLTERNLHTQSYIHGVHTRSYTHGAIKTNLYTGGYTRSYTQEAIVKKKQTRSYSYNHGPNATEVQAQSQATLHQVIHSDAKQVGTSSELMRIYSRQTQSSSEQINTYNYTRNLH